jgi:hypothetical protein
MISSHARSLVLCLALGSSVLQTALVFIINHFQFGYKLAYSIEVIPGFLLCAAAFLAVRVRWSKPGGYRYIYLFTAMFYTIAAQASYIFTIRSILFFGKDFTAAMAVAVIPIVLGIFPAILLILPRRFTTNFMSSVIC